MLSHLNIQVDTSVVTPTYFPPGTIQASQFGGSAQVPTLLSPPQDAPTLVFGSSTQQVFFPIEAGSPTNGEPIAASFDVLVDAHELYKDQGDLVLLAQFVEA
jgi:hypothetical protein